MLYMIFCCLLGTVPNVAAWAHSGIAVGQILEVIFDSSAEGMNVTCTKGNSSDVGDLEDCGSDDLETTGAGMTGSPRALTSCEGNVIGIGDLNEEDYTTACYNMTYTQTEPLVFTKSTEMKSEQQVKIHSRNGDDVFLEFYIDSTITANQTVSISGTENVHLAIGEHSKIKSPITKVEAIGNLDLKMETGSDLIGEDLLKIRSNQSLQITMESCATIFADDIKILSDGFINWDMDRGANLYSTRWVFIRSNTGMNLNLGHVCVEGTVIFESTGQKGTVTVDHFRATNFKTINVDLHLKSPAESGVHVSCFN